MATTAWPNSAMPSWRRASSSVESASTTWVSVSDQWVTSLGFSSIASTSWPMRTRESATCPPKRPRPMTTTLSGLLLGLANDGSLLGIAVEPWPTLQGERGRGGDGADTSDEHEHDQDKVRRTRQARRDAGGEADRGERRGGLEQDLLERDLVGRGDQTQRAEGDQGDAEQGHRDGLPLDGLGDAAPPDHHVLAAPDLGPDDVRQQQERGELDAASRAGAAAADEHEHDDDHVGLRVHAPEVHTGESARAGHRAVGERGQ